MFKGIPCLKEVYLIWFQGKYNCGDNLGRNITLQSSHVPYLTFYDCEDKMRILNIFRLYIKVVYFYILYTNSRSM